MDSSIDLYISFESEVRPQVENLCQKLKNSGLNASMNEVKIEDDLLENSPLIERLASVIKNAKAFVCCLTQKYCSTKAQELEVYYARSLGKPIIGLEVEKLDSNKLGIIISPGPLIKCFNYAQTWSDDCFELIYKAFTKSLEVFNQIIYFLYSLANYSIFTRFKGSKQK